MTKDVLWFFISFATCPVIIVLVQALLIRGLRGKSPQLLTMGAMVVGYPLFFLMVLALPFDQARDFSFYLYLFILYSLTAYTYFHIFNMSETSRRVRMLTAIASRKITELSELEAIYDENEMIRVRLERLVALKQISERNGRYYSVGCLFRITALCFYWMSCLLGRPWAAIQRTESSGGDG